MSVQGRAPRSPCCHNLEVGGCCVNEEIITGRYEFSQRNDLVTFTGIIVPSEKLCAVEGKTTLDIQNII